VTKTATKTPSTPPASPDRRAGIYEHDDEVISLLWYSTHSILDLPPGPLITAGRARDCDLVIPGDDVSKHHFLLHRRSSGLWVTDDASTNGLGYASSGPPGVALKPSFNDKRDMGEGFPLTPGMTLVVGAEPYRFLALDAEMRKHHPTLIEILGREDEVRSASEAGETPGPADFILAANGPGHLLITGKVGCEHAELARIVHKISKRRRLPIAEIHDVPEDRKRQNAILKEEAQRGTLVLHLPKDPKRLDPAFVSAMFSPSYQIRVIVTARTPKQARRALGHQYWRTLMHAALCPMARRRAAIHRLIDDRLAALGSVLRVADLTPHNQQALLVNPWRDNLRGVRETAVRLDAIVRAGFQRAVAAEALGIPAQTFYNWYGVTMRLTKELVPKARAAALIAAQMAHPSGT
jgi:hypothetical protein